MIVVDMLIPNLKTVSEANKHEHWRYRQKRAKCQRGTVYWIVWGELCERFKYGKTPSGPFTITITRISPRKLDAPGNLGAALKAVQDGVADRLNINDGTDQATWHYTQRKPLKGESTHAVHILIEAAARQEVKE